MQVYVFQNPLKDRGLDIGLPWARSSYSFLFHLLGRIIFIIDLRREARLT